MVRDTLNPDKKIYVEYSNEIWNFAAFTQGRWVSDRGCADISTRVEKADGTCSDVESTFRFQAKRSAEIFNIFNQVFGAESNRIVKIHGSQSVNTWIADQAFIGYRDTAINPSGVMPDAIAIAPYFGGPTASRLVADGIVETVSVDEILDMAQAHIETDVLNNIRNFKNWAVDNNVDLIAYEGGQHLVAASNKDKGNQVLVDKLIDANRDPRMYDLYTQYFDTWFSNGGGLFAVFGWTQTWFLGNCRI